MRSPGFSEIRVVNPGQFAAEFPHRAPSSSFLLGVVDY